jgi:hypothetical protein
MKFKTNMGSVDRAIRLVLAAVLLILILTQVVTGTLAIISGIIALVLVLTSVVAFCPLYVPFKFSTKK